MDVASDAESELWGWETFFDEISTFLRDASRQFGSCTEEYALYALNRLEVCVQNVTHLRNYLEAHTSRSESGRIISAYITDMNELLECLRELSLEWLKYLDFKERMSASFAYRVTAQHDGSRRGRPRFSIHQDQLEYLRSLSFTWSDIATLLGVSRMTVFRRRQEFGMLEEPSTTVDNIELRTIIASLREQLPNVGEKMVIGQLQSLGYNVPRASVREAVRETDPINTALRWQGSLTSRRPYSVPGPNSLWHIGESTC